MINKNIIFIDSMQFINSSLGSLVKNLKDEDFKYLSEEFSGEQLKLVKERGIYPYEYMDSFKRFNENKICYKSKFFSSLKNKCVSKEEYERAIHVWSVFKINNMGEYHDLYLKTDVLLLADVFEKFIKTCLNYYRLDPCHYFNAPGLSWDSMLKMTGVKLELISNVDMYLFIEKGMRSSISYISKRYSSISDSIEEKRTIIYWNTNNLYGCAMNQPLQCGEFKFLTKREINEFCLDSISENSSKGYILEVGLEYPDKLHNLHSDYPLAPEKIEISTDMLSKYCSDIANKYGIKVGGVKKLVPNLRDKEKYIVHYKNLQLYLSLGMKMIKIPRVLKFKQSKWLEEYIRFNTEKRKEITDKFNQIFLKLLTNSVYGKCMENIRKRINVNLINNSKDYVKCVSKPNCIAQKNI